MRRRLQGIMVSSSDNSLNGLDNVFNFSTVVQKWPYYIQSCLPHHQSHHCHCSAKKSISVQLLKQKLF
jgi:hypothetical protein